MSLLRPHYYVTDVRAIDLEALRQAGITALLLDVDNTVLVHHSAEGPGWAVEWVAALAEKGFSAAFVSNNWHDTIQARVAPFGIGVTAKAMKPLPKGFRAAARSLGVSIRQCAVVGDQIFTDILGGNLAGATTVLVQPLSAVDLPHTVVLRRIERLIMSGRTPDAGDRR
jgi:HAD superfamily phosphatase (TIGR01668 family)